MESHPTYATLATFLQQYPRTAGATYQTYNDLLLAQQWSGIEVIRLPSCERCGFRGRRPEAGTFTYVVPCSLSETVSIGWLRSALEEFGHPTEVYLAVNADDSSTVYYKLSMGITKPPA
ncbi:tRNA intron endonuclease [Gloeopeniophorella convolvens]|nr:tRNA intron endonuclease [Gloeopeniophorella convolvens]